MKKSLLLIPSVLVAMGALSLSSCKPQNSATEQAAQELNEIRDHDIPEFFADDTIGVNAEETAMLETIAIFSKHQSPDSANEQGQTMLHLACLFKKVELARCLLLDGADPNKRTVNLVDNQAVEGEDSLDYAFFGIDENTHAEDVIALVDLLIKNGANINRNDPNRIRPLDLAGLAPNMEDLFLHVIGLTDKPTVDEVSEKGYSISSLTWPSLNHWAKSMKLLLEMGADPKTATGSEQFPLLSIVFNGQVEWSESGKECAEILLEHGADINQCDIYGRSALFRVCKILVEQRQDDFDEIGLSEKIAFMLSKGADPYLRADQDVVYPSFCAFDFMMMRPNIIKTLREKGFELKEPPLFIPDDELGLLATLCRAGQTDIEPQEYAPYFERLKGIFTASTEVAQNELYPTAVEVALKFMIAIDEQAANDFINTLPSWYAQRDWAKLDAQITPLLQALQDIHEYRIDSKILLYVAKALDEANLTTAAIDVLQMLNRCPDRQAVTSELMNSDSLAMRSGALYAELLAANLPLPTDGMVEAWLTQRKQKADSEGLKKAVLLTSKPRLWFGDMSKEEQEALLQAMVDLGVPAAAEQYKRIIDNLDNPNELDQIMNEDMTWSIELEAAIAAYIWQLREEFELKAKAAPQTPEAHQPLHVHSDCCGHDH